MSIAPCQIDFARYLNLAEELLGGPARAVDLDWNLEQWLVRRVRLEQRRGLDGHFPLMEFKSDHTGHTLLAAAERFRLPSDDEPLRVVRVTAPQNRDGPYVYYSFWAVRVEDYRRLYRLLRRTTRQEQAHAAPILRNADRQRLWDNTIGFLRHGCDRWLKYGVAPKRGVLLLGEPGNGKTMACRWLRGECNRYGLEWHNVSAEEYEQARGKGNAHELFQLDRPGVVFFDDVDMAMRDRDGQATSGDHSTFLGGLDGIDSHRGVVYLFTSNARLTDLDPAFRRPGRIDVVMHFRRPDASLRRRLVESCWHADILQALDIEHVVQTTDGLSFAEMDEVKKLLVMRYFETDQFQWNWAWDAFRVGRGAPVRANRIGFATSSPAAAEPPSLACQING